MGKSVGERWRERRGGNEYMACEHICHLTNLVTLVYIMLHRLIAMFVI
jgi:hypothetical protein